MLVWVQGSVFQIAAGSHPVQEIWGSHDSLYRDLIQKLLRCCREPYQQIPLVITIPEKCIVWPIYDHHHDDVPFRSYWRKGQMLNFWLYRVKQVKMIRFFLAMVSKCLSSKYNENPGGVLRFRMGTDVRPGIPILPYSKTWPLANSQPISKPHFSTGTHVKTNQCHLPPYKKTFV